MHFSERLLGDIKRAEQATQAAKAAILRPFALTPAMQNALAVINDSPGITGAELARRVLVTPQTINSTLARLIRDGLVERQPHPVHRSLIELRLTESGRRRFLEADPLIEAYDDRLRAALGTEQLSLLKAATAQLTVAAREEERRASAEERH